MSIAPHPGAAGRPRRLLHRRRRSLRGGHELGRRHRPPAGARGAGRPRAAAPGGDRRPGAGRRRARPPARARAADRPRRREARQRRAHAEGPRRARRLRHRRRARRRGPARDRRLRRSRGGGRREAGPGRRRVRAGGHGGHPAQRSAPPTRRRPTRHRPRPSRASWHASSGRRCRSTRSTTALGDRLVENLRDRGGPTSRQGVSRSSPPRWPTPAASGARTPRRCGPRCADSATSRDEVVEQRGGRVVTSMNEGDRTIAVFREASAAALAALDLHDRVAREPLPARHRCSTPRCDRGRRGGPGRRRVHGRGRRPRAAPALDAAPGATITSESTAELLVELVGRDVSIVPLGASVTAATSRRRRRSSDSPGPAPRARPTCPGRRRIVAPRTSTAPAATHVRHERPRAAHPVDAVQHPVDPGRADGRRASR